MSKLPANRLVDCASCGKKMRQTRHAWLYRCEACGLLASDLDVNIPDAADDGRIDEQEREVGLKPIRVRNAETILQAIRAQGAKGALLDVGAGPGFFLRAAREAGFAVTGIEPDGNVILRSRDGGFDVKHGYFPDCLHPTDIFDVIVFNDVLEHIGDAQGAVASAERHLAPGGLLVLNCPDRSGIFYRLASVLDRMGFSGPFDRMWQRNLPSPHVWYFRRNDLIALAERVSLSYVASVAIKSLSFDGLAERIFYVRGQKLITSVFAFVAACLMIPLLSVLPNDIAVVILRKSASEIASPKTPIFSA